MFSTKSSLRVLKRPLDCNFICRRCASRSGISSSSTPEFEKRRKPLSGISPVHQQKRWIGSRHVRRMYVAEEDFAERARDIRAGNKKSIVDVLEERGFINQFIGARDEFKNLVDNRRTGLYVGVDPTAPSMHVGHIVPFMALGWFYIHGYHITYLLGGATSKIGDPEGRLTPRDGMKSSIHKVNVASMHMQLKRLAESTEAYAARRGYQREWAWSRAVLNNAQWHQVLTLSEFFRSLGSNVRIGPMLGRDTVKNRLEKGEGMSLAEFCYPLMQAWDWWRLFQRGTQIQIGGGDQFGNILAGADAVKAIAKKDNNYQERLEIEKKKLKKPADHIQVTEDPVGFTVPLLTTATGEKIGKSAGNAIWLDAGMTSVFELYQYFLRSADADVEKYLKLFTFLPIPEIDAVMKEHETDQSRRVAQHKLAREFVELIHGLEAAEEAERQHRSLFKKSLTVQDIQDALIENASVDAQDKQADLHPSLNKHAKPQDMHSNSNTRVTLPRSAVIGQPITKALHSSGLVASRSEAQRLIAGGGAYIGGTTSSDGGSSMGDTLSYQPLRDARWDFNSQYVIDDSIMILRVGKWKMKIINIVPDEEFLAAGLTCPGWPPEEQRSEMQPETAKKAALAQ